MAYNLGAIYLQVIPSFANIQKLARDAGKSTAAEWSKGYDDEEAKGAPRRESQAAERGRRVGEAETSARSKAQEAALERDRQAQNRATERERLEAQRAANRLQQTREASAQRQAEQAEKHRRTQESLDASHLRRRAEQDAAANARREHLAQAHQNKLEQQARAAADKEAARQSSVRDREAAAERNHLNSLARQRERFETAARDRAQRSVEKNLTRYALADSGGFERDLNNALERAAARMRPIELNVDSTDADRELATIQAKIQALRDARIGIDIDAGSAAAEIAALQVALRHLDRDDVDIDIRVDSRGALAELATLNAAAAATSASNARATANAGASAGGAANAFRAMNTVLFAAVTIGPILIPVLAGISGALLGVATSALAAAAGIGVFALGFAGIPKTLQAMKAKQDEELFGQTGAAGDRQQRTAERALRDAQRAVEAAKRGAAQGLASALKRQEDAEEALADAQADSLKAQENLNEAREQAVRDIEDLNNALASGLIDERQTVFSVQEAAVHLNVVLEDEQATQRERDKAKADYDEQVQKLKELRLENKRLAEDKAEVDRSGVEGTDRVKAAQERLADAQERVKDTQEGLSDARLDVTQARVDGAERIARAEENLADTIADTELATSSLATADKNLAVAMASLGPAGRAFAEFLFGLKPLLDELRFAAQEAFLPGLQRGLEMIVNTYGPGMLAFVTTMGQALGYVAEKSAEALTNPAWQTFFELLAEYLPVFFVQWSQITGNVLTGLRPIIEALLPFTKVFGDAMLALTESFSVWANSDAGRESINRFLQYVSEASPKVLELFGVVMSVLAKALVGLAPHADRLLDFFIGVFEWLDQLSPAALGSVLLAILGIVAGFQLLSTAIAGIFTTLGLIGSLKAVGASLAAISGPVGWIILGVVALGAAFVALYTHSEGFRNFIDGVATWIVNAWDNYIYPALQGMYHWFMEVIAPALSQFYNEELLPIILKIGEIFRVLWEVILLPILTALWNFLKDVIFPIIVSLWENVIKPVFGLIGSALYLLWQVFKVAFDAIWFIITKVLAPVFEWLWKTIVEPAFNGISSAISTVWNFIESNVLKPFKAGLELLGDAFETLGGVVGEAWDSIKNAARTPVNFILDTIYNDGLRKWFNDFAAAVGISLRLPEATLIGAAPSSGGRTGSGGSFAKGGVLPGFTPGRDIHDFYSPTGGTLHLSGGEGIIRPDALARLGGKAWLEAVNRGRSHDGAHFAEGGVWNAVGGAVSNVGAIVRAFLSDPARTLADLFVTPVRELVQQLGQSQFGQLLAEVPLRAVTELVTKAREALTQNIERSADSQGYTGELGPVGRGAWSNVAMGPITSRYGPRRLFGNTFHAGTDIGGSGSIHAATRGQVIFRGPSNPGYTPGRTGNQVLLRHEDGLFTSYGHIRDGGFFVNPGQFVGPGQKIAMRGATGNVTGVHLHYQVMHGKVSTNPEPFMSARGVKLGSSPILYDQGGYLPPGLTTVMNATGKPEPVLTADQLSSLQAASGRGRQGGDIMPNSTFYSYDPTAIAREAERRTKDAAALAGLTTLGVSL